MTAPASAWFLFLDKIANAGFVREPVAVQPVQPGLVTIDRTLAAQARERLRVFDRFAGTLASDIPPGPAQKLLLELEAQLVVGIVAEIENALRRESSVGVAAVRAERRAEAAAAFRDLDEIEIWLRDRQADAEANRVQQARARVAEGILVAAANMLEEEDPLAVHIDPTADGNALVRRFERGVQHTQRIHEQFVAPYLDSVSQRIGSWVALHWRDISRDLEAYGRGDTDSTLTALEGGIRAYAEDPDTACDAPRPLLGRGDYLARASARFRNEVDAACDSAKQQRAVAAYDEVLAYFDEYIEDFWPYAAASDAPEVGVATFGEFVRRLQAQSFAYHLIEDPRAEMFATHADFWSTEEQGAILRFNVEWRWRRGEEHLAVHVSHAGLEGVETDESGLHTWRYGTPFSVRLRMARNSPYRFVQSDGRLTQEWLLSPSGHGALLRALAELSNGAMMFEVDVAIDTGDGVLRKAEDGGQATGTDTLRISARFVRDDGRPMTVPSFDAPRSGTRVTSDAR